MKVTESERDRQTEIEEREHDNLKERIANKKYLYIPIGYMACSLHLTMLIIETNVVMMMMLVMLVDKNFGFFFGGV